MTFLLEFDLLMIGVCTFIQKKEKKNKNKTKRKKKQKKTKQKKEKKECKDMFVSQILLHRFFVIGFIIGGLSKIFMRDELRESSLRFFVPWIMADMYLILKKKKKKQNKTKRKKKTKQKNKKKVQIYVCVSYLTSSIFCCWVHHWGFE